MRLAWPFGRGVGGGDNLRSFAMSVRVTGARSIHHVGPSDRCHQGAPYYMSGHWRGGEGCLCTFYKSFFLENTISVFKHGPSGVGVAGARR
jgi:hypothetical protein